MGGVIYHYAQQLFEKRIAAFLNSWTRVAVGVKLFSTTIVSARKHFGRVAVRAIELQNLLIEHKTPSDSSCLEYVVF